MGRYSDQLAAALSSFAGVEPGMRALDVGCGPADFDDYWIPFTLGSGPGGAYCASLDQERQQQLRSNCFRRLGTPDGPFTLGARAFAVRGRRAA
ncbi:MAG: hypothetical protein ACXW15_06945 [Acidimicrobiia bacterium]